MPSYQEIATQHRAGSPPNTDPQRASENFAAYQARMAAAGFPPDIELGESDGDYETRLASYKDPVPVLVGSASYAVSALTAETATLASSAVTASYISSSAVFDAGKTYNLSASYAVSTG